MAVARLAVSRAAAAVMLNGQAAAEELPELEVAVCEVGFVLCAVGVGIVEYPVIGAPLPRRASTLW